MKLFSIPDHPNELLEVIDSDDSPCIIVVNSNDVLSTFWSISRTNQIKNQHVFKCMILTYYPDRKLFIKLCDEILH